VQLLDAVHAAARDRLVGARHEPREPGRVVQRLEHRHRRHRGAVGVGDDPLGQHVERSGLTSDTTSGTSGSLRQAELLSITTAAGGRRAGASFFEVEPPAEKNTTSSPAKSAVSASSTTISRPSNTIVEPAERAEANSRSEASGKFRSASSSRIIPPTRPVAPTMPTWGRAGRLR
jgi:hypothetical protein